jgi:uncharacterized protein YjbI with pentapeptide repeats
MRKLGDISNWPFRVIKIGYLSSWTGFKDKTIWDLLQLFIIPIVLSLGVLFIQNTSAKVERDSTLDNQRQEALITYFDRMETLLLDYELSEPDSYDARVMARARTLTVLRTLDNQRKGYVLQFLHESYLINKETHNIDLEGSDFTGVNLEGINLSGDSLYGIDFSGANLRESGFLNAYLGKANLSGADLSYSLLNDADLSWANLSGADLQHDFIWNANLSSANLSGANLAWANLDVSDFHWASLRGACLTEASLTNADLSEADLFGADLSWANLSSANLSGANLAWADLSGADLSEADLSEADLTDAWVTVDQLAVCLSLTNATMPNGTKYEEWVAKGKPDWNQPK